MNYQSTLTHAGQDTAAFNKFLVNTFGYMCVGVLITALVTLFVSNQPGLMEQLFHTYDYIDENGENAIGFSASGLWWALSIAELLLVVAIVYGTTSLPAKYSWTMFLIYSALNGITISPVIAAYTGASVAVVFFISAAVFASAAIYGKVTDKDLTSVDSFFLIALIGLIIAMVVNMIIGSTFMDYLISCAAVVLFIAITAFDVQMLREMHRQQYGSSPQALAVYGALSLYLDFINIFLHLLKLLGSSDD